MSEIVASSAWQRLGRITGLAGLAAVVLIFGVLVGSRPEPAFTAAAGEFLTHYRSPNTVASPFRSFVLTVALIAFVWFVGALATLLRRAEGEAPPWRSSIAMVSGGLFVATVLSGNEVAAVWSAADLDPQIARYAFDEAQAAFANGRVALGSFAVCCGLGHRVDPIPPPLGRMACHRERCGARPQPHRLDQPDLAAALPGVLVLGAHCGRAAPAPQLPR